MLNIFRKKQTHHLPGFFPISTDIHSHILPGIDDGSPDLATSLSLIEGMMQLGITSAVATPHIIGDMYRNSPETIIPALEKVRAALTENNINFSVKAAAEYMLDEYFLELITKKIPLLTVKDNLVLTEFSYAEKPLRAEHMVFSMITEGYRPILAHPERYGYYHQDYRQFDYLHDLGFLLQVNLLSLTGYYGKPVAKAAAYIIKNGLASFAGTDLHHDRHLQAFLLPANRILLADAFSGKKMNEEMIF
ncbi:MAG: CpsB/CapC family capsule biosynthesis tyrosine phosphatase [Ferruginibacter sp.]